MRQKIVLAGGSGFIGHYLRKQFAKAGYEVIVVSRSAGEQQVSWSDQQALVQALDGADMLVNLAGKSINCRFTDSNKKALLASRISTTEQLGAALQLCSRPPALWVNASGAHIYSDTQTHPATEADPADGSSFPAEMARAWEHSFFSSGPAEIRRVAMRLGVVLGSKGGVLQPYLKLARLGLGGRQGNGEQYFSWVHISDIFHSLLFLMQDVTINGPVNVCAPGPVPNKILMQQIRQETGVRIGLPAPAWAIRIGSSIIGTDTELVLGSLWAYPSKLLQAGYVFRYPALNLALHAIISKK